MKTLIQSSKESSKVLRGASHNHQNNFIADSKIVPESEDLAH